MIRRPDTIILAKSEELKEGQLLSVAVEGISLILSRHLGEISIFEGTCPHQGSNLAEGIIEKGQIVCPSHQWRFDCHSGERDTDVTKCLQKFNAILENGHVAIAIEELATWKRKQAEQQALPHSSKTCKEIKNLPGPKGLPLVGNLLDIDAKKMHQQLEDWAQQYGDMFKLKLANHTVIVVSEPSIINEILKERPGKFRRMQKMETIAKEMEVNGVFTAEGDAWKRQRYFAMQGLASKHLRQFFPTLKTVTTRLKQRWEKAALQEQNVEVQKDLMRFTVDVTASLAFGQDMNTLEQHQHSIQEHLDHIFPMIQRRMLLPIPYWKYFKLPADRKLDYALKEIKKTINEFIQEAKSRVKASPALQKKPNNFLEALVIAQDEAGNYLSDKEIFANVFTMLLAGEDTTANTLAWVMYYMAKKPEMQKKMQEEADQVLGKEKALANKDQAQQLTYIEAVANEAMRLKPVVPTMFMSPNEAISLNGTLLPKGTQIILLTRVGVMDPQHFKQAVDFRPERWTQATEEERKIQQKTFIPFGSGPRLCPGRALAILEIKTALAMICRNFTITQTPKQEEVEEQLTFTMGPKELFLKFELRKSIETIIG